MNNSIDCIMGGDSQSVEGECSHKEQTESDTYQLSHRFHPFFFEQNIRYNIKLQKASLHMADLTFDEREVCLYALLRFENWRTSYAGK